MDGLGSGPAEPGDQNRRVLDVRRSAAVFKAVHSDARAVAVTARRLSAGAR